jgi:SAM-dependent methyltransferase
LWREDVVPVLEVPRRFDRSANIDRARIQESAVWLLRHTCECLGITDLSDRDVLDVGCGTKFTEAILNHDIPIGTYTGVDVYREMIDFLASRVADPRFAYHHADLHNALYNPDGAPMTDTSDLGVGERTFDIIWLFSVFTHLDPSDYTTMLKVLRRYARPDSRLFFTVYIDELTQGGYGYIDWLHRTMSGADEGDAVDVEAENQRREPKPFVDVFPDDPLKIALYSRDHAYELIEGTGWKPLDLLPPVEHAQHQFICTPA